MSVWVGGSVADVKQNQAVLPTKNLTLTLLPASPRPIFRPFVRTPFASYGAIGQKERWMPMASHRADWVNYKLIYNINFYFYEIYIPPH